MIAVTSTDTSASFPLSYGTSDSYTCAVKTPPREAPAPAGRHRDPRSPARRRPLRRRTRLWIILLVLAGIVALGAVVADGYLQTYRFARDLEATYPKLTAVRDELKQGTTPSRATTAAATDAVARLRHQVDGARFTFGLTGAIPFVGRPVDAVRLATDAAVEANQASLLAGTVVDQLLGGSALISNGAINLDRLKADAVTQLSSAARLASRASLGFRLLPDFLGQNGPRTYFLAMQNNADQRATGGAVLAYGLVRVDRGRIQLLDSGSAGDLDRRPGIRRLPEAPPAIRWYLRE